VLEDQKEELIELREICQKCSKPVSTETQRQSLTNLFLGNESGPLVDRWGCVCRDVSQKDVAIALEQKKYEKKSIGNWVMEKQLSSGYLGDVYLATHTNGGDKACLRIFNPILSHNRRIAKRFLQEAEKAAALTHRNIGLVFDHGTLPDGTTYVVSEYIEGISLEEKLKLEGFLDPSDALHIAEQICDALSEAHEHGVLHRGIRPNNIMIQPSGLVKLINFGIEKAIPSAGRVTQCLSAVTGDLSDPHYMSPEQCTGNQLSAASDVYALGCVMYEMLTGKKIFDSKNWMKVAMSQLNLPPEPFNKVMYNCEISDSVELIVLKALKKQADQRYRSAASFQEDINAILHGKRAKYGGDGPPVPDVPTFARPDPKPPDPYIPQPPPVAPAAPKLRTREAEDQSNQQTPAFVGNDDSQSGQSNAALYPATSSKTWTLRPRPWDRMFARLIDTAFNLLVGCIVAYIGVFFLQVLGFWHHNPFLNAQNRLFLWCIFLVSTFLIEPILLSRFGTTPGKACLCIKVRNAVSGGKISFTKALRRTAAMIFRTGGLVFFIPVVNGFVIALFCWYQQNRLIKKGITTWDRDLNIYYRHYKVPDSWWFFIGVLAIISIGFIAAVLVVAAGDLGLFWRHPSRIYF